MDMTAAAEKCIGAAVLEILRLSPGAIVRIEVESSASPVATLSVTRRDGAGYESREFFREWSCAAEDEYRYFSDKGREAGAEMARRLSKETERAGDRP